MNAQTLQDAQDRFTGFMPDIQRIAGSVFSSRDPEAREEAVAETVAQSWMNWLSCVGKDKAVSPSSLAHYGMLGVKSGRSITGSSSTDVLSPRTRILARSHVQSIDAAPAIRTQDQSDGAWWDCSYALTDRRIWENPQERVRLKVDYGAFLKRGGLTRQEKRVFRLLTRGHTTDEMAGKLGVSSPRVCQIKSSLGEKLADFMDVSETAQTPD